MIARESESDGCSPWDAIDLASHRATVFPDSTVCEASGASKAS
jgi:hypothetical protein